MINKVSENERAIWILKRKGEQPLKALAAEMNISTEGARFQLLKLSKEGYVKSESRAEGRGRPQQYWSLTRKGHARFPDKHSDLTKRLIETIRENFGESTLDQLIRATGEENLKNYRNYISDTDSLETRIEKLAKIRSKEGYMAHFERTEDGDFLLIEDHCPICAAAEICQGFCASELRVFQSVLGADTVVERTNHILAGARRCAYSIKEKTKSPTGEQKGANTKR